MQLVLSLLRQLSADSAALQSGVSAEWLAEHLPARSYADAVTDRAAKCSREVDNEECSICLCESVYIYMVRANALAKQTLWPEAIWQTFELG